MSEKPMAQKGLRSHISEEAHTSFSRKALSCQVALAGYKALLGRDSPVLSIEGLRHPMTLDGPLLGSSPAVEAEEGAGGGPAGDTRPS